MGTGYLMMLPDIKGAEEKHYLSVWQKFNGKNHAHDVQDEIVFTCNGPNLHLNYETLDFFIKTFENRNILQYFQAAEKKPKDIHDDSMLQDALRILQRAEVPVRLPVAEDWRESVIKGAAAYKINQIMINLPIVYDEYLFRIKSEIAFPETEDQHVFQEYQAFTTLYRQQVKEGKKLSEERK
jgi:hypothetical protein